eukprot:CAMPEP_0115022198 /NCGR_PEP_ID=MMETSP0216-20121206/31383_1 /TAXON_ID=223996 /ORGANISM="Protocruzia adherens, Strain Boccale" /LENGTH=420 /DNA_ID=CAMNT_0002394787 /DNA_START=75 /DNA_END=1337 /DNA_ORIENTATION=+
MARLFCLVALSSLFILNVVAINGLTTTTYKRILPQSVSQAYELPDGNNIIVGEGIYLAVLGLINTNAPEIATAKNVDAGSVSLCTSLAFDDDDNFYVVALGYPSNYILQFNAKFILLNTYQLQVARGQSDADCGLLGLESSKLTWYTERFVYEFAIYPDSIGFTKQTSYSTQTTLALNGWVASSNHGTFVFGSGVSQPSMIMSLYSNLTVQRAWTFQTIGAIESMVEVKGLPGIFVIVGEMYTSYGEQYVGIVQLTPDTIEIKSLLKTKTPVSGVYSISSTSSNSFVLYGQDTVLFFETKDNGASFTNAWSLQFSSSLAINGYSVQTFETQTNGNLLMYAITRQSDEANGGYLQLVEIDTEKGGICDCSEVQAAPSTITFQPVDQLTPDSQGGEISVNVTDMPPWSINSVRNLSDEDIPL